MGTKNPDYFGIKINSQFPAAEAKFLNVDKIFEKFLLRAQISGFFPFGFNCQ